MNPLTLSQIAQLAAASLSSGEGTVVINKVSTDSRTIKPGELFVALRGENFEGHDFVEAAAKAAATGALVDLNWTGSVPNNFVLLRATDTLQAYQTLAANYRRSLALKVLAITGSNGKTSTKDFAAAVLGRRFRVTKTEGNFNNHVGLPRTILEATSRCGFAHGAECIAGRRRWAGVWIISRGMCGGAGRGAAHESALANQGNRRRAISRRQLQCQPRLDESGVAYAGRTRRRGKAH